MKSLVAAGAVVFAGLTASSGLVSAAPSASTTISTRQANFKKMGGAMKALKDELGGSADKAKMVAAAKTLAATGRAQAKLFPAGTGPTAGVKTDALATIWSDRAGFDNSMSKFIAEADKLVAAAGTGNTAAIGAQFKVVGAACGACHREFRADD
jgi:Cytochrome c556